MRRTATFLKYSLRSHGIGNTEAKLTPQLMFYQNQSRRSFTDAATPATKEPIATVSSSSSAKSSKEESTTTTPSSPDKSNPKVVVEEKTIPVPTQIEENFLASLPPSAAVNKLCDDILVLNVVEMQMLLQLIQVNDLKYFWS